MSVTLYHNPQCSKSRQTLQLLEERGEEIEVVLYLQTPPTTLQLAELCKLLGIPPLRLIRVQDPRFLELEIDPGEARSDTEWLELMVQHPAIIQRPIVRKGPRAALGRPPEQVLEIL